MSLSAQSFLELCQALECRNADFTRMTRSPVRINGMWRCELAK